MCDKAHYDDLCKEVKALTDEVVTFHKSADKSIKKTAASMKSLQDEMIIVSSSANDAKVTSEAVMSIISKNQEAVAAMIKVYNTGSGLVDFLKWLSKLVAACTIIWASVQAFIHWRPH